MHTPRLSVAVWAKASTFLWTFLCVGNPLTAGVILIQHDGDQSRVIARSAIGSGASAPNDTEIVSVTSLPFNYLHDVQLNGWTTTATYNLRDARFDFAFQQQTGTGSNSYTNAQGAIYFKMTDDTPYTISGSHLITDHGDPADTVTHVFLADLDNSGALVFGDRDRDIGPTPQSGSPTGVLQANRRYLLSYHFELYHVSPSSGDSSGVGSFSMVLPEPATALCAVALLAWRSLSRPTRSLRALHRL